jgi:hypothetical protein
MKKYSQSQNFISVLMIFILLIQLSGCIGFKNFSRSDFSLPQSSRYHYSIYCQNSNFPLESINISNGILSGKVDFKHTYRRNAIHLYVSSDKVIKISTENILSIPLESVTTVKKSKFAAGKTLLFVIGGYTTFAVLYFFIFSTQMKK